MNDEYVPRSATKIRAHRWLPGDAQTTIDMLEFLKQVGTFGGIEVVNNNVALDVKELAQWVNEGDWVVLDGGNLKQMHDANFVDEYRRADDADA